MSKTIARNITKFVHQNVLIIGGKWTALSKALKVFRVESQNNVGIVWEA